MKKIFAIVIFASLLLSASAEARTQEEVANDLKQANLSVQALKQELAGHSALSASDAAKYKAEAHDIKTKLAALKLELAQLKSAQSQPLITSISPMSGPAGTTITVVGKNFSTIDPAVSHEFSNYISFANKTGALGAYQASTDGVTLTYTIPTKYYWTPGIYHMDITNGGGFSNPVTFIITPSQVQTFAPNSAKTFQAADAADVTITPTVFTRDLTIGSTGSDVTALQNILVTKGFLAMPAGVAKGSFGTATQAALARYQASLGIYPANGYFGQTTRAKVNLSPTATPSPVYIPAPTYSPSPTYSVTPSPAVVPSPVLMTSPTVTPSITPSVSPSPAPSPSPSVSPTPTPSIDSRAAAINNLYPALLNRPADTGGFNYFYNSGMTIDQIRSTIMQSTEYQNLHPVQQTSSPSPSPSASPISTRSETASFVANVFGILSGWLFNN